MIVIGERINSSLKAVRPLIESKDAKAVQELAKKQLDAGASYLDINASAVPGDEALNLKWIIETIQEVSDIPFSISSTDPKAIEAALKSNKNPKPIINSICDQNEVFNAISPILSEYGTKVIALCMSDDSMPETVDERLIIADRLVNRLASGGFEANDIFIDPVVRPIGTNSKYGIIALDSIREIRSNYPGIHITCDVPNISFGLPARKLMNQAFLIAAMASGMDSVILDPLDAKVMSMLFAGNTLLGMDDFCMDYMMKFREGSLEI